MKTVEELLPLLKILVAGFAKQFGEGCEFVVHDYAKDFGSTIVAIENGQITGREVGKGGTDIGLRIFNGYAKEDGRYNYISQTQGGRTLRSSTIYLKDDEGKVIGSLCVNSDITDMVNVRNQLDKLVQIGPPAEENAKTVVFDNVENLLISLIGESIEYVGTPVALMTREQKIKGINYLNQRGAFLIKNAGNIVAQYYDVSRYTIYNYISPSPPAGTEK